MYNQAGSIGSLGISSTFSDAQVAAQGFVGPYLKAIAEWWEGHRVTGGHRGSPLCESHETWRKPPGFIGII